MATKTRQRKQQRKVACDFAQELRENVLGIELMCQRIGRRRSMSERHQSEVADHFGAARRAVGGNKRLYAPNQKEIKAIAGALIDVRRAWQNATIGYRKGIRLLRKEQLENWKTVFEQHEEQIKEALREADAHYEEILDASREFLGSELFDRSDYPASFVGSIVIAWCVHNFEPSEELLRLAPETYEREQLRVRQQFQAAIVAYEQEARNQLAKLVEALLDKLKAADAGKKVVYTEGATTNLREFFNRFEAMNIRSDEQLNELVGVARDALGDTTMADVKRSEAVRRSLSEAIGDVAEKLGSLVIEAPVRAIDLDDLD